MTAQQLLSKLEAQLAHELATPITTWFHEAKVRALIARIEALKKLTL